MCGYIHTDPHLRQQILKCKVLASKALSSFTVEKPKTFIGVRAKEASESWEKFLDSAQMPLTSEAKAVVIGAFG